ncbi:PepSY-associated TM helix domain-containing protein [Paenactinomyces guangxiensis]|uniref:PepSY-associated TM helix domain-containing protein n=1 Tax=Paenactinomyces guangxiensis TaxID=1490290 RepID=UPI002867DA69|nr:PepSY domain-containing protein [Paenactinomyces guangxiensis]
MSPQTIHDHKSERREEQGVTKQLFAVIWRWHFYAGIIFAPWILLLAISGGVYIFKPQIELMLYKDKYVVQEGSAKLLPTRQIEKVKKRYPQAEITHFTPSFAANRSSEVGISLHGQSSIVFVNPYNGNILGKLNDEDRWMEKIKALHNGELWGATAGNRLIELTACWAFILVITGLYLWWPRHRKPWQGTIIPRLKQGKRTFWRDLHAVPAFWLSAFILLLIFTGLPWSGVWGDLVNRAATATHTGQPPFAAVWGPKPESTVPTKDVATDIPWAAENLPVPESTPDTLQPVSVEKMMAIADSRNIQQPYSIYFPEGLKGVYTVSSSPQQPEDDATLHIDQ